MRPPKNQDVATTKNWEHRIVANLGSDRGCPERCETFRPFVQKHPIRETESQPNIRRVLEEWVESKHHYAPEVRAELREAIKPRR